MRFKPAFIVLALLVATSSLQADMFVDLPVTDPAEQLESALPDLPAHNHPLWPCWQSKPGTSKSFWQPLIKPKEGSEDNDNLYSPKTEFPKEDISWLRKTFGKSGSTKVAPLEPPCRLDARGSIALVDDFFVHLHAFHKFDHRIVAGLQPWYHRDLHDRQIQALMFRARFGYSPYMTTESFLGFGSFPFKGLAEEIFAADVDPYWKRVRQQYLKGIDPTNLRKDRGWDAYYKDDLDTFVPPELKADNWDDWLLVKTLKLFSKDRLFNGDTAFALPLREAPERVLPLLVQLLSHPHPQIRWNAIGLIYDGGHPRLEYLLSAIETHPDPVVAVRAWAWRRRLRTADTWVARGLKSRSGGVKARALEQLGRIFQPQHAETLKKIYNEDLDLEHRTLAARALLLSDSPPHKEFTAGWKVLQRDRAAEFMIALHPFIKSTDFKKYLKVTRTTIRDWLKRKDKQNVGLVRRNEDFDLLFRHLWRKANGEKKKEAQIWKLFGPKSPDVNWEARYMMAGALLNETTQPAAAQCSKILEGWLARRQSLASSRTEAAEFFWGACTRMAALALANDNEKSRDVLARKLFIEQSKALVDYASSLNAAEAVAAQNPEQSLGHVHKIKMREHRILVHRHRLWDLARRHVNWNSKDLKMAIKGLQDYQSNPTWSMGWAKTIALVAKPTDGKALTLCIKSLHNPSSRRLAVRNLVVLDFTKKTNREFALKLIKDKDPWLRFHAHRLLEQSTGHEFYMNPDNPKNTAKWTKAWRAAFKN